MIMHFKHSIWHDVMLGKCSALITVRVRSGRRNSSPCSGHLLIVPICRASQTLTCIRITWDNLVKMQILIQKMGKGPEILHF